ncbi:GTP cyclohydrolase II, partial [Burkholderia sp. SIMBA_042]
MLTSHDPSPTADGAISEECVVLDATATLPTR